MYSAPARARQMHVPSVSRWTDTYQVVLTGCLWTSTQIFKTLTIKWDYIVTRSGCWGFLLRLLPITETTLEYSLGPFILPRKPSLHVQAIWNHKPFAFTWVAQPSLLKSKAQLSSNLRAPPDFHTFNQSDLTILTWANQLLPHHFVAFMR